MKLTEIGKDVITVNEKNLDKKLNDKIHLINLKFEEPTFLKMQKVFSNFNRTNRFIVSDNIRTYNNILKKTNKKYYVMNQENDSLISFFKRNNKVILNTFNLSAHELNFIDDSIILNDILYNLEIIMISEWFFKRHNKTFISWQGNVIIKKDGRNL